MDKSSSFPRAIIHIDADAFFVSCEQALRPELKGKPVVVGRDRGIATALSYAAKRKGVRRGMTLGEIKRVAPDTIILDSDYETYCLFSRRLFAIMRRFSPVVEEYSIDEGFMDITGQNKPLGASYEDLAATIKSTIQRELDLSVSVGLAPNKVLAKLASNWNKPDGLAWIRPADLPEFLREFAVESVWGIGPHTAEAMRRLNIFSAYDLAVQSESFVKKHFAKPQQEIWRELQGTMVYSVITEEKTAYASISKTATFRPTDDRELVYAELVKNIENACRKARRYDLVTRRVSIWLKTQSFHILALDVCLTRSSHYPEDIIAAIRPIWNELYTPDIEYRATGVVLADLTDASLIQSSLFESSDRPSELKKIYQTVDLITSKFGRAALHLGSSLRADARTRSQTSGPGPGAALAVARLSLPQLTWPARLSAR